MSIGPLEIVLILLVMLIWMVIAAGIGLVVYFVRKKPPRE
jgi:hypothetical protein